MDKNDFSRTYAVFLMMFLFISIICILAAMIVSNTKCMTIALNNHYVFDDLKRLGAFPAFLKKEVKNQAEIMFKVPILVGMSARYILYAIIMFANDGKLVSSEIISLSACLGILFLLAAVFYVIFRHTVKRMCCQLDIL